MIRIKKHTEGDSMVAKAVPTIAEFDEANDDHVRDVKNLADEFADMLKTQVLNHDYTKRVDPYSIYRLICLR